MELQQEQQPGEAGKLLRKRQAKMKRRCRWAWCCFPLELPGSKESEERAFVYLDALVARLAFESQGLTRTADHGVSLVWPPGAITHHEPVFEGDESDLPHCDVSLSSEFENKSSVSQEFCFNAATTCSTSAKAEVKNSFTAKGAASIKLSFPKKIISGSATMENIIYLSETSTKVSEKSFTLEMNNRVTAPEHTRMIATIEVKYFKFEGQFTVKTSLSGSVVVNITTKENVLLHSVELPLENLKNEPELARLHPSFTEGTLVLSTTGSYTGKFISHHKTALTQQTLARTSVGTQTE